eukprot:TRINITY_DN28237_c0_g1_i2.p1 TRINITY_DN28237_c0_g1~~TRINITY_DN28237_c0_g1_i2.p1  ORF type:complete len:146 (-),score=20.17 TRINITY_DN28237_c0_g1_i2:46-483(-)
MYDKVIEQAESFLKPMNEIFELNAETLDALRVKQTDLVNEVLSDSIEYAKSFSKPNLDMDSFVETQQSYWEGLRSKLTNNAQDSFDMISDAQGKVSELLTVAWEVKEMEVKKTVAKKKPAAKKAAPKAKVEKVEAQPAQAEVSEG